MLFGLALGFGLVAGGLGAPSIGMAAPDVTVPPRRPPILPPAVPPGAPEHLAYFTYVEKINQAWGRDWPFVIHLFEEFDARYPGNPVVYDKLYASYGEHGNELWRAGDLDGARRRFLQAERYDPARGEAPELLDDLDRFARRR
ncbi:MAG: hypothetical protein M3O34_19270 [Chloroflexota bacterium]|nr:hypothetical protein [Chloroflexota bacterium]